jgi:GTPase SAR1 family protein
MLQKKVCLLGAAGVGKRSLTSRFEESNSPDQYRTSIGVRISRMPIRVRDQSITLSVWDVGDYGERIQLNYLHGMSGYLLVADGTRLSTLERVCHIYGQIYWFEQLPPKEPEPNVPYVQFPLREVPFILLLNKSDLVEQWKLEDSDLQELRTKGWPVLTASAKENRGVEEAFLSLSRMILDRSEM